jgi:predicted AAA+ superfamily ATPase
MQRLAMDQLKVWKENPTRKPLILRGARQVGKTYLLKQFGEAEFPNYHYINFEEDQQAGQLFERNLDPERILNDLQLYLEKPIEQQTDLVIFDEIQRCPKALTSLKYFREKIPELALCAAGSLIGIYLSWDSFPVGQVTFLGLYPMTFEEFLLETGRQQFVTLLREQIWKEPLPEIAHTKLWDLWKRYLITGGMPEVIEQYRKQQDNLLQILQKVQEIQKDLINTYMADIAKHSGKTNAMHIERLWRNVPAQLARSLDGSATKFKFKDAIPGYRGYERLAAPIDWLEKTGLILKTSIIENARIPLYGNTVDNRFKLYLLDVGLLGAMNGILPTAYLDFDFSSYKGYIAENFVAQELVAAGYQNLFCWEGRTSEVEFLIEVDNQIMPVEVKSGHITKSKSLTVYEERYQPKHSFILSGNNIRHSGQRSYIPIYAIGHLAKSFKS